MNHELKTHPEPYTDIFNGIKTFEYRKNDRNFKVGDTLTLKKYDPDTGSYFTGCTQWVRVTHVIYGPNFGIPDGYCIMYIKF